MAVELGGEILVLDCGVTFDSRGLGIDRVHADFAWLLPRKERVLGLVLTHGHEDHVGAVSWFLRDFPVPVWGPPYALALVKHHLAAHPFHEIDRIDLRPMQPRVRYGAGPFDWEIWRVTHSMPDTHSIVLRTPQGILLHTGDFKIDRDPPQGDFIDLDRVAEIAREGVRVMLSDSTNALTPGHSGGEKDVASALEQIVRSAPHRVVVGLFASNVARLTALFEIARASGRRVAVLGRSIETHVRIASELRLLRDPHDVLVPRERASSVPRHELLVLATGSQGEAPAALPRLAAGTHPDLELDSGDRVVLSSRIIPGNERAVLEMINAFERRGIPVAHWGSDRRVHASGHAHRDELRALIEMVRPRAFLPVHGTWVHLAAHADIAREAGVPEVFTIENGTVLEIDEQGTRIAGAVPAGRIHIDHHEPVSNRVIHDRALLAQLGVVFVSLLCDRRGGLLATPQVITRGVVDEDADPDLLADLADEIRDALDAIQSTELAIPEDTLRDVTRRAVRGFFGREFGRKPLCYVLTWRVDRV
jgi:ribonuclease J